MEHWQEETSSEASILSKLMASPWTRISKPFKHQTMLYPLLLGTVLAWFEIRTLNWAVFLISLIAIVLMVESSYVSNDYFDYDTDKKNVSDITGGSKVLVEGSLNKKQVRNLALISFLLALPLGIVLQFYFKTGVWTLPLGLTGMLLAYAYSGKPFRLSYRGLGEISLAINNSWTPIFAGYYLQTHQVSWLPTIVSLPYLVGVMSQKLIREFPDEEADRMANRRSLVVIFGRKRMAPVYSGLLLLMVLLYVPFLSFDIRKISLLLLLVPIFFFAKNFWAMQKGAWKNEEGIRFLNANGFLAMFMVPVSIMGVFLLGGL